MSRGRRGRPRALAPRVCRIGPALAGVLLVAACGAAHHRAGPLQRVPSPLARAPGGPPSHIALIVLENHEYGQVIGSPQAPYINRLASAAALARNLYAIAHPSLPNYLALTGGSTFSIDSDCTDCSVTAKSLVDQLEAADLSWKAYMEGLPHSCFTGASSSRAYAKKHDPFAYYTRVTENPARCRRIVPLDQLAADERAGRLPDFLWITPNLCHDMHDCPVAAGDRFLAGLVPALLRALGPRGLLIVTWDEGTSDDGCCRLAAGGHVPTILAGGDAEPGARLDTPADTYSILQTVEDLLGLPRLRAAACPCTPSLERLLRPG
jgi:hypothetical protein